MITYTTSEKMNIIKCLLVCFCIPHILADSTPMDVTCPKESGVRMEVSGVVSSAREGDKTVVFVKSSDKSVTVTCQADGKGGQGNNVSLNLNTTSESQQESPVFSKSQAQVVAWKNNYTTFWSSKTALCKLENDLGNPSCKLEMGLLATLGSDQPNCTRNSTSLHCNLKMWATEAIKEKKGRCANLEVHPKYEFYMYHSSNQNWSRCDHSEQGIVEKQFSDITCQIDQLILKGNETVLIKLRKEYISTGFVQKVVCEDVTYTTISEIEINIYTGEGVKLATYAIIIVLATAFILLIVFCFLMNMKKKFHKRPTVGRTKRSKTFIRGDHESSSLNSSCTDIGPGGSYLPTASNASYLNVVVAGSGGQRSAPSLLSAGRAGGGRSSLGKNSEISDNSGQSDYRRLLCKSSSVTINDDINVNSQVRALDYDNEKFDISRSSFKLEYIIGDGEYGTVYKAIAKGIGGSDLPITVAAKEVKNILDRNQWLTIVDELKILSYLDTHYSLVNLVAAYTENIDNHELFLLLEYCPYGNLKKFLIDKQDKFIGSLSNKPGYLESEFNWTMLLTWSYSIASGMDYLVTKNIMHGDLAARNVLIGDNYSAKISDFGLSKMMYYNEDYRKTERRLIPLAWMAIEYLRTGEFNMLSDVWSFGVTLWEMFSLGNKPYGLVQYETLKKNILAGERLEAPEPLDLHPDGREFFNQVIQPCWNEDLKTRPTFADSMLRITHFLGNEGIQAHKRDEQEYLRKMSSENIWKAPEQLPKKAAPTGYVRMESMEKPQILNQENSPTNCKEPYTQLANFGGPYSKMTSKNKQVFKAEPSGPGYIEMSTIINPRDTQDSTEQITVQQHQVNSPSRQPLLTNITIDQSAADKNQQSEEEKISICTKLSELPSTSEIINKSSESINEAKALNVEKGGLPKLSIASVPQISVSSPTP